MTDLAIEEIQRLLGAENVLREEPMSAHTSFRVGGPAALFVRVGTLEALRSLLAILKREEASYFLLGKGSNLLVGDGGYRGCVITMADPCDGTELTGMEVSGTLLTVGAGMSMAAAANAARDHGLAGLEFASGIPGTVGGALVMNAGAYGGSMDSVVETVTLLMPDGNVCGVSSEEMHFGYRHSLLKEMPAIALRAQLRLSPADPEGITARMKELSRQRSEKQPLDYPSAGSTFKRPEGTYAGKLIMDAGLAGYTVGGAAVSEKHCGFVINRGGADAADIRAVIRRVRRRVYETSGISLEEEVISLGSFPV